MKVLKILIFFKFFLFNISQSHSDEYLFSNIKGCFCEGGFIFGRVGDSVVKVDNVLQNISNDGYFIYAFTRKFKESVQVEINKEIKKFDIKKKKYLIERINNLPRGKVTPSKENIKKIIKDKERINQAKKLGVNERLFGQNFLIPVKGRISGIYGSQRVLNGKPKRPHYGLDIAAKTGSKVFSPTDGVIKLVDNDMFYTGKTIIIDHGLGVISIYAHLNQINVKEKQIVKRGEVIGHVGKTGRATGPHLHWGVYIKDRPVDPQIILDEIFD